MPIAGLSTRPKLEIYTRKPKYHLYESVLLFGQYHEYWLESPFRMQQLLLIPFRFVLAFFFLLFLN